eukprot:4608871-Prymnesium_polylepis.2
MVTVSSWKTRLPGSFSRQENRSKSIFPTLIRSAPTARKLLCHELLCASTLLSTFLFWRAQREPVADANATSKSHPDPNVLVASEDYFRSTNNPVRAGTAEQPVEDLMRRSEPASLHVRATGRVHRERVCGQLAHGYHLGHSHGEGSYRYSYTEKSAHIKLVDVTRACLNSPLRIENTPCTGRHRRPGHLR